MDLLRKSGASISSGLVPLLTPSKSVFGRTIPTAGKEAVPDEDTLMYGAGCCTGGLRNENANQYTTPFKTVDPSLT
jgi:hypothetical protein